MAEHLRDTWAVRQLRRAWRCVAGDGWLQALCRVFVVVALLGLGGLLFVAAGLMPIAASEGHWDITRAFLQFTMRSSVRTSTLGLQAPPLDDPALVLKGAGHYAAGCMPCHGGPGIPADLVVRHMTPRPPYLPHGTGTLRDEELFWIVRHGIKYTAMPAWPAQAREDEVWAMVAFLRELPGMAPAEFRRLAYGDSAGARTRATVSGAPVASVLANCERCHGADGMGRGDGAIPRLAGLDAAYLSATLRAFAEGRRYSGIMQPVAAGLEPRQIQALASHFAALDGRAHAPACSDAGAVARGAALATRGDPARKIPACTACHGPRGGPRNRLYPVLEGQHADYIALQLRLFRDRRRGGTDHAGLMRAAAARLEERDILALAAYYGSLPDGCPGAGAGVTPRRAAGCAARAPVLQSGPEPGADGGSPCTPTGQS